MSLVRSDVWNLRAQGDFLANAAAAWSLLAQQLTRQAAHLRARQVQLEANWEAPMATSYFGHSSSLADALTDGAGHCQSASDALTGLHGDIVDAQSRLQLSFGRASSRAKSVVRFAGLVTFVPWEEDDAMPEVDVEYRAAEAILDEVRQDISDRGRTLVEATMGATAVKNAWVAAADGSDPGWDVPTGRTWDVQVTSHGNTTVVTTGDRDDTVTVSVDPATGETVILIDDGRGAAEEVRVPAGQEVVINTGRGDDTIIVEPGTDVRLRFATGIGDDTINSRDSDASIEAFTGTGNDIVEAGAGNDYISVGAGEDYVDAGAGADRVFGGHGNDVLYGMDGEDVISGGAGDDYLEGGAGDDRIFGGAGRDVLSGGFGDDQLFGGAGRDTIYAGGGSDTIDGQGGRDTVYAEESDGVASPRSENVVIVEIPAEEDYLRWLEFHVDGSPEFRARVLADLQMMASSPTGQAMLERMGEHYDNSGFLGFNKTKVTITDYTGQGNWASQSGGDYEVKLDPSRLAIDYRMDYDDPDYNITPPVVFFFHELGHINQYRSGEDDGQFGPGGSRTRDADGQPLIERQNVGLTWDHDNDPSTPDVIDPDYEFEYTENGFRDDLGLPRRNRY